ncbi:hypothetical protein [Endozoicomonas arenosclerae]|uniref:hypothetical protein n=1 Tax=Endozoicomonas arenosclerae TaxID=1633495 RepID=UPI000783D5E9|nr:hypothetical protein [Endozoicomonas arenosclerae]
MTKISNKNMWLLINFALFTIGALFSSYRACSVDLMCVFKGGISLMEMPLFLLTLLIIWIFSWGLLCKIFYLEPKESDRINSKKAFVSYALSLITSFVYPYIMFGG